MRSLTQYLIQLYAKVTSPQGLHYASTRPQRITSATSNTRTKGTLHISSSLETPHAHALISSSPIPSTPDRWIRRHGTPYWNPNDVVSIQVNGQTIYSASRTGGVTINQLPFRPYFRVQFRSLMFHFRWSLDILGWFIRKCLQCPHWRHHQVTSPFAE